MTACVNKNHGRRVAGVVTASLVGALTLGGVSLAAVPTVALAEQGAELQAIKPLDNLKITAATDGQGNALSGDLSAQTFANGSNKYLVPTGFTSAGYASETSVSSVLDVTYVVKPKASSHTDADYTGLVQGWTYNYGDGQKLVISNSTTSLELNAQQAAAYFGGKLTTDDRNTVKVADGNYEVKLSLKDGSGSESVYFGVGTSAAKGYTVVDADGNKSFTYNGKDQELSLKGWTATDTATYNVFGVEDNGSVNADRKYSVTSGKFKVTQAGKYVVVNDTTDAVVASFEVAKIDLSSASLTFDDVTSVNSSDLYTFYANGDKVSIAQANSDVKVEGPSANLSAKGSYKVTVTAKDTAGNFTGSGSYTFNLVDSLDTISSVSYGRKNYSAGATIEVEKGSKFDATKVAASVVSSGETKKLDSGKLEISYSKDGKAFDPSTAVAGDKFDMHVKVKAYDAVGTNGAKELHGSDSITVSVKLATSQAYDDQVGFYLDGKLAGDAGEVTYDGTDQLKNLKVVIKDDDGNTLAEGTDYTLEVKNKSGNGDVVTEAVNADTYTVTVKDKGYEFNGSGLTFKLKVNKADVSAVYGYVKDALKGVDDKGNDVKEDASLYYNGSDITTPAYKYYVLDSKGEKTTDDEGNYVLGEVPADAYNVVSILKGGKEVSSIKEAGEYTVNVAFKDSAASNYKGGTGSFQVNVKKAQSFTDVDPSAWYAAPVETAYNQNYVNGIGGTQIFAPNASITRADAVGILFNMAGGKNMSDKEFSFDQLGGYVTGFKDVDGHAYYAKALAWAKAAGVANGYGDGSFAPEAKITREEFAALVANYAKATGKYVAPETDELSKLSDAHTVSGWAKDVVNWAVANKVMGNGGFVAGQASVTRAEVAAMGVNFQPKNLDKTLQNGHVD